MYLSTSSAKLIGITPEYTTGDRWIAWGVFGYSIIYKFFLAFVVVVIWNAVSPWKVEWWGHYFFITTLLIPGIVAFFSTFWFGIGGAVDLFRLFRDLEKRVVNPLDNGWVEGHVSLSDKETFDKLEKENPKKPFTLIELLVVIAIIAILASIPSAASAI